MVTAAKSAFGVTLARTGNVIAEITKFGGVKVKRNMKEVTNHQSANGYVEVIPTLKDGGSISIEGNFISSDTNGQVGLLTDFEAGTLQDFVFTFPTSITATWTFSAYVEEFATGETNPDGELTFSASLRVQGKPVLAITASNNATNIVITTGTLYPTFAAGTYDYVATSSGDTCTVTVTFAAGTCTLKVNGASSQALTSGVASSSISLGSNGDMTTITLEIEETGKTKKTYTIRVGNTV